MKYKGIIFDLDGVICFTDHYHYLAWKALADKLGIYFDETINNRLRGVSRMASLDIVLERSDRTFTDEEKLAMAEEKNNSYREYLKQMSPADLAPEVKATLDWLRGQGLLLAIGSSSKNTRFILAQLGLGDYFDKISDGTNITRSKPSPAPSRIPRSFSRRRNISALSRRTALWWRTPRRAWRPPLPAAWTSPPSGTLPPAGLPPTISHAFPI